MRNSQSKQNGASSGIEQDMVGLYDDCAIIKKEIPGGFSLVQITRMRKTGQSRGYIEYREPIPLNKLSEFSNVKIIVRMYKSEGNDTYKVSTTQEGLQIFSLRSLILPVELTISYGTRCV